MSRKSGKRKWSLVCSSLLFLCPKEEMISSAFDLGTFFFFFRSVFDVMVEILVSVECELCVMME